MNNRNNNNKCPQLFDIQKSFLLHAGVARLEAVKCFNNGGTFEKAGNAPTSLCISLLLGRDILHLQLIDVVGMKQKMATC
ncbi:hypothetical protein T4B_8889 [Trichinella pseudospiralis]|uniref:Uncharacterized protein n=2 Tax=Trichinella pseudospiralis TaxID=6337 RepID=A0A0V1FLI1_TRIPS|nr:hypothetical protein T4D_2755 [Trichinella pseudospiralis]KRZ28543.1 hypothetical protein T4B_8889 [Trichinella pseudospiralis]KRZ35319.1 hypothetical protein T4C_5258 [Trichinella pseudospiralis]